MGWRRKNEPAGENVVVFRQNSNWFLQRLISRGVNEVFLYFAQACTAKLAVSFWLWAVLTMSAADGWCGDASGGQWQQPQHQPLNQGPLPPTFASGSGRANEPARDPSTGDRGESPAWSWQPTQPQTARESWDAGQGLPGGLAPIVSQDRRNDSTVMGVRPLVNRPATDPAGHDQGRGSAPSTQGDFRGIPSRTSSGDGSWAGQTEGNESRGQADRPPGQADWSRGQQGQGQQGQGQQGLGQPQHSLFQDNPRPTESGASSSPQLPWGSPQSGSDRPVAGTGPNSGGDAFGRSMGGSLAQSGRAGESGTGMLPVGNGESLVTGSPMLPRDQARQRPADDRLADKRFSVQAWIPRLPLQEVLDRQLEPPLRARPSTVRGDDGLEELWEPTRSPRLERLSEPQLPVTGSLVSQRTGEDGATTARKPDATSDFTSLLLVCLFLANLVLGYFLYDSRAKYEQLADEIQARFFREP